MTNIRRHLTFANAIAAIALFVAPPRAPDAATIPKVTVTYLTPWLDDLEALGDQVGANFTTDALARFELDQ
jgi:hypothetical protein